MGGCKLILSLQPFLQPLKISRKGLKNGPVAKLQTFCTELETQGEDEMQIYSSYISQYIRFISIIYLILANFTK